MAFRKHIQQFICAVIFLAAFCAHAQVTVLPNAHAHNDYLHKHPLQDALHQGFSSFEADVFLKNGELILAHVSPFLKHTGLEALYLKPFADSANKHNGFIYTNYPHPVILLIDIKTDAEKTFLVLKPLLEKYAGILSSYENATIHERAVTIILSGNKPYDLLKNETMRYAFIDESLLNVEKNNNSAIICPLASTKYSNVLTWKGKGEPSSAEKEKLKALVASAHAVGKKVRLWASPENKNVWKLLLDCGVDLINTDDLEGLRKFLK